MSHLMMFCKTIGRSPRKCSNGYKEKPTALRYQGVDESLKPEGSGGARAGTIGPIWVGGGVTFVLSHDFIRKSIEKCTEPVSQYIQSSIIEEKLHVVDAIDVENQTKSLKDKLASASLNQDDNLYSIC